MNELNIVKNMIHISLALLHFRWKRFEQKTYLKLWLSSACIFGDEPSFDGRLFSISRNRFCFTSLRILISNQTKSVRRRHGTTLNTVPEIQNAIRNTWKSQKTIAILMGRRLLVWSKLASVCNSGQFYYHVIFMYYQCNSVFNFRWTRSGQDSWDFQKFTQKGYVQ